METTTNLRLCDCTRLYCTVVYNEKYMCHLCAEAPRNQNLDHIVPTNVTEEFGCSQPISFNTSEGIKTMRPGKAYDKNLNEIK